MTKEKPLSEKGLNTNDFGIGGIYYSEEDVKKAVEKLKKELVKDFPNWKLLINDRTDKIFGEFK